MNWTDNRIKEIEGVLSKGVTLINSDKKYFGKGVWRYTIYFSDNTSTYFSSGTTESLARFDEFLMRQKIKGMSEEQLKASIIEMFDTEEEKERVSKLFKD